MIVTDVVTLEGAMPSSVAITLDILHVANNVCRRAGRPPAFHVRLAGSGAPKFAPFLYEPPRPEPAAELIVIPAQGLSKAESIPERLAEPDAVEARALILEAAGRAAPVAAS